MSDFQGLHITWTCYGTWLPGDERGHVSDVVEANHDRKLGETTPGTPFMEANEFTRDQARALLKHPPVFLDATTARVAALEMVDAARKRGWHILRAAFMRNHVHSVITNCPNDGPAVRRVLKGTSQAKLSRHVGKPQAWWTHGGSDRYKNNHPALETAVVYVARQEGKLVEIIDMIVRDPVDGRELT